jgi:hypothetical protein
MARPAPVERVRPWIWEGRRMPDRSGAARQRRLIIPAKKLIGRLDR